MYKIIGTNKIKNVLTLDSLGNTIGAGQTMTITDNQFDDPEIQKAKRTGYIEFIQMNKKENDKEFFTCINIHSTTIKLPNKKEDFLPGQKIVMTAQEYYSNYVQDAIANEFLSPAEKPEIKRNLKEGVVDAGRFMEENNNSEVKKTKKENNKEINLSTVTELKVVEKKVKNPKNQGKKESTNKTAGQIIQEKIKEAQSNMTISEVKKKVNPKKSFMTANLIEEENPEAVDPTIGDPRGCSVAWTPGHSAVNITDLRNSGPENNSFVDQEQIEEKIKQHPKLKGKGNTNNSGELDFVE